MTSERQLQISSAHRHILEQALIHPLRRVASGWLMTDGNLVRHTTANALMGWGYLALIHTRLGSRLVVTSRAKREQGIGEKRGAA